MEMPYIPYSLPTIGQEEIDEVADTLRSGWLTTGPKTAQFEREFQEYVHAPYALAVNSATAALHLSLAALGIGPGDEVITTPLTFCATVNTILHVGATPILADVGPDGNIDPQSIAERLTERTRAIIPVHLGGLPCDMDSIWQIAHDKGLYVIEDAAHAAGAHYKGYQIGAGGPKYKSDAVCYSFYATKNMTTGEGGMVVTHNEKLYEKMRVLCLHGISKDAWNRYSAQGNWYYEVIACGFKYNLSDIQSCLGIHQLRKLDRFTETRTGYARRYNEAFRGITGLKIPYDSPDCRNAWHIYAVRVQPQLGISRDEFIKQLRQRNVGTSVHFIPIFMHPYFAQMESVSKNPCPKATEIYSQIVSLPLYASMTEEQVEYVIRMVQEVAAAARRTDPVLDTAIK